MEKFEPFTTERPWGNFRQFSFNTPHTVKIITVKPHEVLSLQSHQKRSEFWHVISGSGEVQIGEEVMKANPGDEFEVPIGTKHRIRSGENTLQILELGTGEFDEEDITRYEDKYGRV